MIIVGEKINTSRKAVAEAVEKKDAEWIQEVARAQAEAGADYIDVNAGTFLKREEEYLTWLVETVQAVVDLPLCIDSPDPGALESALARHKGEAMINSISLERDRWDALLPVVSGRPCKVVALCMAQASMPTTAEERIEVATDLLEGLHSAGVPLENIYVDPLVQPVSVDVRMGPAILDAIAGIRERFPEANTICGLSNVSYGLPSRKMINRHFLVLAMQRGLNAAILDPTDKEMRASLLTARMLLGEDEYCGDFIEGYQQGLYP